MMKKGGWSKRFFTKVKEELEFIPGCDESAGILAGKSRLRTLEGESIVAANARSIL